MESLDPFQRPPDGIRHVYKKYQKMHAHLLDHDPAVVQLDEPPAGETKLSVIRELDTQKLAQAFHGFAPEKGCVSPASPVPVYEHQDMPGLHIFPNLLPPEIQTVLLDRLLHRDLSTPVHLTNIHAHYNLTYPARPTDQDRASFFSFPPTCPDPIATPLDPSVHRPLSISQLLNKKLRWNLLGGQYDWTAKRYPDAAPPEFPPDIKAMLESVFEHTKAEAAIVNLYSPGDTLSVHRDVAEFCSTGLISISIGCDAIFVIGTADEETGEEKVLTLRLKSGSAVYMSGASRFAWHGVPQIVPNTCPPYLQDWPAGEHGQFGEWRGWMRTKRINLNVRQMWHHQEDPHDAEKFAAAVS